MDRRSFMGSTAAVSLASLPLVASAAGKTAAAHGEHAAHVKHTMAGMEVGAQPNPYQEVLETAGHCVTRAEACLAHCIRALSEGDQSMADCARAVNQMLALCQALQRLAAQRSALTSVVAKTCIEACRQCADACQPHIDHHVECRDCHDACLTCIKACEKVSVK
ncbi:MAG: four-helix bundle copper-binding protein [Lautropia sp.]|nr:four-helix bundle copper-binding protein [Lautropia sp.]